MKYTILDFNQEAVCSISKSITDKNGKYKVLTLDVVDLLIIQEIADFMNRKKIIKYTIDDKTYFSIKYDAIIEDLPILGVKKQALRDRIDKMCELGVIEKQVIKDGTGSYVAFRLGDVYEDLKYKSARGVCSGLHTGMYSTTHGCVEDYTPNNYTTITNNTITNIEKENIKEREKKKNDVELPDYIAPEYRDVMTEWLEYKKERRETYKSRGLKQCYDKLIKFSNGNPDIALDIIHTAMSNNYSGFFPIKNTPQQAQTTKLSPYEQQQLERQRYTAMFERRIFDNINSLDDDEETGCGRLPDDI